MTLSNIAQKRFRLDAVHDFEQMTVLGKLSQLWDWLAGRRTTLLDMKAMTPYLSQQRFYRGIREIPLAQIVGSVGRHHEYSRRFHPLRESLRERWVTVQVLAYTTGWSPIDVYKIGPFYFVEDGHHRVSVARRLKNRLIEARVWEYPLPVGADDLSTPEDLLALLQEQSSVSVVGGCICQPSPSSCY